ncbi:MAG: glycosyltransferase [Ruminiclostridium sp.]|nr:glycosyltransferase [Ruminiclostridium sp.]
MKKTQNGRAPLQSKSKGCNITEELEKYIEKRSFNRVHTAKTVFDDSPVYRCDGGVEYFYQGVKETSPSGQIVTFEARRVVDKPLTDYCTLKNMTKENPGFPVGKVYGRYERYPLTEGDCDGGLRTKGIYKKDTAEKPLITYVTVVYNRIGLLPRCMESVFSQDYDNIEYIVVDGGSTDGTLELIKAHEEHIDYYVSQRDKGIYNAMNKAISLASGRVICFINSDDYCTAGSATKIAEICRNHDPYLIMGRRQFINDDDKITEEIAMPRHRIRNCTMMPLHIHHQSTYAHRDMFEVLGEYNEQFGFIADYRWESKCLTLTDRYYFTEENLSVFSIGGLTGTSLPIKRWNEWSRLTKEVFPMLSTEQCDILQYGYRHYWKYSDIEAMVKAVRAEMDSSPELARAVYETGWYVSYTQLFYLMRYLNARKLADKLMPELIDGFKSLGIEVSDDKEMLQYLDKQTEISTAKEDYTESPEDFRRLYAVKKLLNSVYIKAEQTTELAANRGFRGTLAVNKKFRNIKNGTKNARKMLKLAKAPYIVKGIGE